ncbi:MspA family porin, partial [Mycolicibacterium hippocampi]
QQWDTFLNGVFPLDRNRLTREWFHSGKASYIVAGEDADEFEGTLELGYQVGFPWSLGVGINFSYTTPNIAFDGFEGDFGPIPLDGGFSGIVTPPLFPGVSISADLGNGPGIQEVATFSVDVEGPGGSVAVSNAHGTVTGAAGGVLLRPFARLVSSTGDSVTTYGEPWN